MNTIHKSRLAKLAIALLDSYQGRRLYVEGRRYTFDMEEYATKPGGTVDTPGEVHTCGTSCCFLGFAPLAFETVRDFESGEQVSRWLIGVAYEVDWEFLFDSVWSNDPSQAARRALLRCRLQKFTSDFDERTDKFYLHLTDEQVRQGLLEFAYPTLQEVAHV